MPSSHPPPSSHPTLALPEGVDGIVDEDTHDLEGVGLPTTEGDPHETAPLHPRAQPARQTSVLPQVPSEGPLPFENRPSRPPPPAAGDPTRRPGNTATGAMPMPGSSEDSSADWPAWSPGPASPSAPPPSPSAPPPAPHPPIPGPPARPAPSPTSSPPPPPRTEGGSPWAGGVSTAAKRPVPPKPSPPPRRSSAPPAAPPERLVAPPVPQNVPLGEAAAPSPRAPDDADLGVSLAVPAPKPAPEPEAASDEAPQLSLEDYAALRARLEARPDDEERWLEEAGVDRAIYDDADERLSVFVESSALDGDTAPLERFDAAYVAALAEAIERPLDLPTYAAIEVGAEGGRVEETLERLGLPEVALGSMRRHVTHRAIDDDSFRRGLRDEMTRLRHGS